VLPLALVFLFGVRATHAAGYAAYLTKPVHEAHLYECLTAVVLGCDAEH
jgi:hypothetical protein